MNKIEIDVINSVVNPTMVAELAANPQENKEIENGENKNNRVTSKMNSVASKIEASKAPAENKNDNVPEKKTIVTKNTQASEKVQGLGVPYRDIAKVIERYSQLMTQALTPGISTTLDDVIGYIRENAKVFNSIVATEHLTALSKTVAGRVPTVRSNQK